MVEPISKREKKGESVFGFNLASSVLAVMISIPLIYTIVTNFPKAETPPVITPVTISTPTQNINAESKIEAALKSVVDNPGYQSYLNLGLGYYSASRYSESIQAWEKALEYNPKSDLVYNNIAAAYGAMQKWDEEIEACNKALAINPKLDLAKRNLEWATGMKNKK